MSGQGFEVWCEGYGSVPADLMFVGISAGRLGALQTHVPFTKDASGRLLQRCLGSLGLSKSDEFSLAPELVNCYITNLVKGRCLTDEGLNRLPTMKEILWWQPRFVEEVEKVEPKLILCLGEQVFSTVRFRYPRLARQLRHPRWYQAHGALSNEKSFRTMVFDYAQEVGEVAGETA
jgi:uracil-DNA glycosylase family 4